MIAGVSGTGEGGWCRCVEHDLTSVVPCKIFAKLVPMTVCRE
jgi:hypothetical protein